MIETVVMIRSGLVTCVITQDSDNEVVILDMDNLTRGDCPRCCEPLTRRDYPLVEQGHCMECGIDWKDKSTDIAEGLLGT
ncbi:MAG: hypothetical protein ACYSW3_02110 [Planctomycetota bacterium]|jgi:hypothetical protein